MSRRIVTDCEESLPKLSRVPVPAKALVTAIILTMSIAMAAALGQIIIHDIIPTFFRGQHVDRPSASQMGNESQIETGKEDVTVSDRGDLFADSPVKETAPKVQPFYQTEQFIWTLKWTHIHIFGMNMIFIFMGAIAIFLDLSATRRTWLVVLPFVGVLIDIAAMWLKGYVSPAFFWLHIPGGGLFGLTFIIVSIRALWEMLNDSGWINPVFLQFELQSTAADAQ